MPSRELTPYVPNPALAWVYHRFFSHIVVDEAWAEKVRAAEARGTVLYVLRNVSFVDFLALDYLTKQLKLPEVRFANDLGLWVLEPFGKGWLSAMKPRTESDDVQDLRRAIEDGGSAALFLKRPKSLLDAAPIPAISNSPGAAARKQAEGDTFLQTILEIQRKRNEPILLVPQVFVWSKQPDQTKLGALDGIFGPREWPGKVRTVTQFLLNYQHVTLRAGEPVDVGQFLASESKSGADDALLARRLSYVLLRRLERERRAVVGPSKKPLDRVREEVLRSPKLQRTITDLAGHGASERRIMREKTLDILKEMETALDMNAVGAIDKGFEATLARMYSAIEVDEKGLNRLREAVKDGTLVLLPSHKSHVDYLVLSRIFYRARMPVPCIAAGDNLSFFPLGSLFRRGGAFFIRRTFKGDKLYVAVVDAYMRRLLKDGWPLEFFLEGGRSRTGKLLTPKLGLLSMVVDAALGTSSRKVYFCPISIGYERVVEEGTYIRELAGGDKAKEDVRGLVKAAELVVGRYGRLNVQFGELITINSVLKEMGAPLMRTDADDQDIDLSPTMRRNLVSRLAYRVMNEINQATAVTPGALVATALLTHRRRGIPHRDMVERCHMLANILHGFGARFTPSLKKSDEPFEIRVEALREACDLFFKAGHLEAHRPGELSEGKKNRVVPGVDAIYVVPPARRMMLDLSKNIVVHFFVSRALVATALLREEGGVAEKHVLSERVQWLSRLFKYEFQFRADATFENIFEETLGEMEHDGEIVINGNLISKAADRSGERVVLYASIVRNFVEGYRIAAKGLTHLLRGSMPAKELTKRTLSLGERMFLAGDVERRESVSRPLIENAFLAFLDLGYLAKKEGKFEIPESYESADAVSTIESRILGYLGG